MKKPNFFIIGAPKCGTTALASYLAEHTSVFMTDPKEPQHYNTDLKHGSYKDRGEYLSLFERAGKDHKAVGEASVWYLYSQTAVQNILNEIPDAKFIVMLRNPVDMAQALHEQMVFSGYEAELDFEKAWALQAVRKEGNKIPVWCKEPKLLQYRDACMLGRQYVRVSGLIQKWNILPLVFDDFKSEPQTTWARVLEFLDVPGDRREEFPVVNPAKERRSLLLKRANDLYCDVRNIVGFKGFGTGVFSKLGGWNIIERKRVPLKPEFSNMLRREFREDIERLEIVLDRDLSAWMK